MPTRYPGNDRYRSAAVCRRGHAASAALESVPLAGDFCSQCGSPVLRACTKCEARIRGSRYGIAGGYRPPDFCDRCGEAHPWASRQAMLYRLRDQLDSEALEDAERRKLEQLLEKLESPNVSAEDERRFVERLRSVAPRLMDEAKPVLRAVITQAVLKGLGL